MRLSRWPLWLQLACAMTAASVVVAVAAGYFMRAIETDYLRDELRRESLSAAQALSSGMPSVRTGDGTYELSRLVSQARQDGAQIYSLALIDRDGRTITRWVSQSRAAIDEVTYFKVPTRIPGRPETRLVVSWNVAPHIRRVEQHVERIRTNVFVAIALLSGLLVLLVHFLVVRPVGTLQQGLDRLARGGSSLVVSLSRLAASELARLAQSVRELGHYQHELRDVQDSLVEARQQAELASEAKGRFLAVMSHEIRTPISGVVGNLELLDDEHLSTSQRALVNNAQRSADSLLEIINEILDFSRIESGRLQLENTEFQLEAQLNDVASSVSGLLNAAVVELVVDFDPALPGKVVGDPLRLRQVLTNLLGNAVKFTAAGHIVLQASRESDERLQLTVRDSGIGIDAQKLEQLFEPFTQADSSTSRHYGGTGLGLSISKQLVELMGGQISVASEPGGGSVFRVLLPLVGRAPAREFASLGNGRNRVVLLASNSEFRDALSRYLISMGLVPLCADDEFSARAHIRDAGQCLYALMVDSATMVAEQLPALIVQLRDAIHVSEVKVILLLPAGVAVPQDTIVDAAVLKPVKRDELYSAFIGSRPSQVADSAAQEVGIDDTDRPACGQVLLVDDNPMNVQVAQAMLQRLSLAVDTANSGARALQLLADHAYDVVLMDEQMPEMDGLEVTRLLRQREQECVGEQRHTIVVALTANADSESQRRCLAAGMDGFLAKPVRRKALRAMLARWIAHLPVLDGK